MGKSRYAEEKTKRIKSNNKKLWRECWDINDYADLDQVFAGTEDYKDILCEVEILLQTHDGNIETVSLALFDDEQSVMAEYTYRIFELGRVELKLLIASINNDPEDEEEGEAEI